MEARCAGAFFGCAGSSRWSVSDGIATGPPISPRPAGTWATTKKSQHAQVPLARPSSFWYRHSLTHLWPDETRSIFSASTFSPSSGPYHTQLLLSPLPLRLAFLFFSLSLFSSLVLLRTTVLYRLRHLSSSEKRPGSSGLARQRSAPPRPPGLLGALCYAASVLCDRWMTFMPFFRQSFVSLRHSHSSFLD